KALFGLPPAILAAMLFQVLPALEQRRTSRLESREERKRKRVTDDGRPRTVTPLPKVLRTLVYLRHNVNHAVVGALFGFSADTSENAFHEVVPVWRDLFPAEQWEAEKRWRKGEPTWTPEAVDKVIVDSFETPVRRPSLHERQKRLYAGKKKRHTLKTQIATDQEGAILQSNPGHRGPQADLKLYEEPPLPAPCADQLRIGDKAYGSQDHPEITTPHQKPTGGELTEERQAPNKESARQRSVVEHAIRRIKGFRILR